MTGELRRKITESPVKFVQSDLPIQFGHLKSEKKFEIDLYNFVLNIFFAYDFVSMGLFVKKNLIIC